MAARPHVPDAPNNSAGLSLLELRRQLLRRAGVLSAKARDLKEKGSGVGAARLAEESGRLLSLARTMGEKKDTRE